MKKQIILAVFAVILISACQNDSPSDQTPSEPGVNLIKAKLSGPYNIVGFEMKIVDEFQARKDSGYFNFGKHHLTFRDDDTVLINPEVTERIFKLNKFKYEITRKNITFTNGDIQMVMPYDNDLGIIRMYIEHDFFHRIDLVLPKELR